MSVILMLVGMLIGIFISMVVIYFYNQAQDDKEREARLLYEENQRRKRLKEKQNEIREDMSRNICEEARKGLQRRDEG